MSQPAPRRSYFQILALLGTLFALSGWNQELVRMETKIFEVTVTAEQAASMDFDFEVLVDKTDEKTEDLLEDLFGDEVDDRVPNWLTRLVYVPYLVMGLVGLLSLLGFRKWGRWLGAGCMLLGTVVLAATTTAEIITPDVIHEVAERALPADLELSADGQTGPAIFRLQIGSLMIMLASIVALVRPDRLAEKQA